jgi:hypothetical protein
MEALPFCAQTSAKSRVNPALNAVLEPTGRPFGFPDCPGCQGFKLVCVSCYSLLFVEEVGRPSNSFIRVGSSNLCITPLSVSSSAHPFANCGP